MSSFVGYPPPADMGTGGLCAELKPFDRVMGMSPTSTVNEGAA